jgi:hypothetical protein
MALLLIALTCAVIGGAIGQRKGIPVAGALLGLFLGPLGVAIVWALRGARRECPACFTLIHARATVCPQCRRDVPDATIQRPHPEAEPPAYSAEERERRREIAWRTLAGALILFTVLLFAYLLGNS